MKKFDDVDFDYSKLNGKQISLFKEINTKELQSYIKEINRIKNLNLSKLNPTKKDIWETQQLKLYAKSLSDLDGKQTALLLSTQGLTNAQVQQALKYKGLTTEKQYEVMLNAGLLKSKQQLTNAEIQSTLQTILGSNAKAKETMESMKLAVAIEGEESQTVQLTKKKIALAVASGNLTKAQASELAMHLGLEVALGKQNKTVLPQWLTNMKAITLATKDQIIATGKWLVTSPAGWATMAIGAIIGVVGAFKKFVLVSEEAQENLDDSVSEFKSVTDEIKSLEEQLKSCTDRIAELQNLADNGTISVADEKELELLKEENKELERKIALKQTEQIQSAKDVLDDAQKLSKKKVVSEYSDDGLLVDPVEELQSAMEKYDIYDSVKYNNAEDQELQQKLLDDASARAYEMYDIIEGEIDAYETLIDAGQTLKGEDASRYEQLKKIQDEYLLHNYAVNGTLESYKALNTEQQKSILYNKLIAQGLSDAQANSVLNNVSDEDYADLWNKDFSFTPPEMTDYATAEEYGKAYAEAWLEGIVQGSTLDNKTGNLSTEELNKNINTAFDSIKKSHSALQEFKEAMSNGMTESALDGVAGLSDELKVLVAEFHAGTVSADELYSALTEHYNTDLENYGKALIEKNQDNAEFYNRVGLNDSDFVNHMLSNYYVDLKNCKDYNTARLEIEKQTLGQLSFMWGKYYDTQTDSFTSQMNSLGNSAYGAARAGIADKDNTALQTYKQLQAQVSKYRNAIKELENITYNGIESSFEGIGGSSSSKSSSKTTFDRIETKISRIQRQISNFGKTVSATYLTWSTRNNALLSELSAVNEEILVQKKAYETYLSMEVWEHRVAFSYRCATMCNC